MFDISELFNLINSGVETGKDHFISDDSQNTLNLRLEKFIETPIHLLKETFDINEQPNFKLENIKKYFTKINDDKFEKYAFKPFQNRKIYYDTKLLRRSSISIMSSFVKKNHDNVMLLFKKRNLDEDYHHTFITKDVTDRNFLSGQTYCIPLYIDNITEKQLSLHENKERTPNLNMEIVKGISDKLGLYFSPEKPDYNLQTEETNQFYPIDILDYIYAVLHSPTYREKYKEFLKIDFPRIPYPKDAKTFWELVELGSQIRQIHLLESAKVEDYITEFPIDGDCIVTKPKFVIPSEVEPTNGEIASSLALTGRVYINETQYFDHVPEIAWNFYIGGYQPAQKWLKDRKDRKLEFEDIAHYQKIIVALAETDRLMKEIDKIEIESQGI